MFASETVSKGEQNKEDPSNKVEDRDGGGNELSRRAEQNFN